jgi:hypothetical protein
MAQFIPSDAGERAPMPNSALTRFMGGPPISVFTRLLFVSLIVGAIMMWLDITPDAVFSGIERFVNRVWNLGFDAIREIIRYVFAGAAVVVPIWLILRLLKIRNIPER